MVAVQPAQRLEPGRKEDGRTVGCTGDGDGDAAPYDGGWVWFGSAANHAPLFDFRDVNVATVEFKFRWYTADGSCIIQRIYGGHGCKPVARKFSESTYDFLQEQPAHCWRLFLHGDCGELVRDGERAVDTGRLRDHYRPEVDTQPPGRTKDDR